MCAVKLIEVGLVKDASNLLSGAISCPADAVEVVNKIARSDREHFACIHLSARNQANALEIVSTGSLNASLVHPREVFKAAILNNAASVILAHNHPSGDATPSREDIELTRRMVQAGELLGIEVLDHLIVTPEGGFLSMKEANLF